MVSRFLSLTNFFAAVTPSCGDKPTFFGLVPWYQYLPVVSKSVNGEQICSVDLSSLSLKAAWLVPMAIFEDLLRVAGMLAVGFVIYGGIRYITSQGEPDATKAARGTIINALIGLAITIVAASTVQFIASKFVG